MLADRIKSARKRAGFTQAQLASALFVSQNAIHNWETGKRSINRDVLSEMAVAFSMLLCCTNDGEFYFRIESPLNGVPVYTEIPTYSISEFNTEQWTDALTSGGRSFYEGLDREVTMNVGKMFNTLEPDETMLLLEIKDSFELLNTKGQKEAVKRVYELVYIPELRKDPSDSTSIQPPELAFE